MTPDTSPLAPSPSTGFLALLDAALDRSRERLTRALDGLTAEQASARPVDSLAPRVDSLAWLAWHIAREIDLQISGLAGTEPLWTSAGWSARFDLPLPDTTEDWHHTPEESAQVTVADLDLLTGYLDAAYALARSYVTGLSQDQLEEVADDSWDPPVTRASRLASIIDDAAQHSGQAVWARRLLGVEG